MQSENDINQAIKIFEKYCDFVRGASAIEHLPEISVSEVGFIGRSNVGKSSLINAITRKKVARSSNTPGRTQQINFFNVAGLLMLVDMPGYGYAKAPKDLVAKWQKFTRQYLKIRVSLKKVYVLIDSRHGIKENDIEMMSFLESSMIPYQVVLTKIDKISAKLLETIIADTMEYISKLQFSSKELIVTSSGKGVGIDELRSNIVKTCLK